MSAGHLMVLEALLEIKIPTEISLLHSILVFIFLKGKESYGKYMTKCHSTVMLQHHCKLQRCDSTAN